MTALTSRWDDNSKAKQQEREDLIRGLAPAYHEPCSAHENRILAQPVAALAASVRTGNTDPADALTAYGKMALKAHADTNCLTEIMISSAETWARDCNRRGPLAGVPVSLKDVRVFFIFLTRKLVA